MSDKSTLPQFGRAYEISVLTTPDALGNQTEIMVATDSWEPEALRVTFEIEQVNFGACWFGDIAIYNMNSPTEQAILKEGQEVVVKAGYQAGQYGEIFRGKIFQPLWERENVTDYKVTLHCMLGLAETSRNFINMSHSRFASQADLIQRMAAQAHNPIPVESLDVSSLSEKRLPRGKALFGNPAKYLEQAARDYDLSWWIGGGGLNMGKMEGGQQAPLVYSPSGMSSAGDPVGRLIGTPQQTTDGVTFRTLMDPRLRVTMPPQTVKLDMSAVRQAKQNPLGGGYFGILDQDGTYIAGGLRFTGDTRGNDWYSDVTGYTSVGGKMALLGETQQLDPHGG